MLGLTSAESYATAVRGTCYGFSAAIGKVGAVAGTQVSSPVTPLHTARADFPWGRSRSRLFAITSARGGLLSVALSASPVEGPADSPRASQIIAAICGLAGMTVTFFFIRNE